MKKLYSLPALLLLVVMLFISGCGKNDCTECCEVKSAFISFVPDNSLGNIVYAQLGGTVVPGQPYYYYTGGAPQKVQFFVGRTTVDICTGEHLNIEFTLRTSPAPQTRPLKIFGEMYWSLWGDDIILFDGAVEPDHTYTGSIHDLGLKQAFPEGAATVDMYITVEFESLGSFDLDADYFEEHVALLQANFDYKRF